MTQRSLATLVSLLNNQAFPSALYQSTVGFDRFYTALSDAADVVESTSA